MVSEWALTTLDKVATLRNGAGVKQDFFSKHGVPLARVSDFTKDSIDISDCKYVDQDHAEKWETHFISEGDVIVATVGSWPPNWSSVVGKVVRAPREAVGAIQNQNTCCILPDDGKLNNRFLFYRLKLEDFVWYAGNVAGGSANQARLPIKKLASFTFPLPPLPEQKAIAHILGSLDDKIELNRQMNATLEGMAQALFKSWFVDFDPVIDNALAAGNPIPDALAARAEVRRQVLADGRANRETAKPFPATFHFTEELGWIPEGWEASSFGDILRSVSDTFPLKEVDKVIFLNTGDILNGQFLHHEWSDTKGLPGQAKKSIQKEDILYSEIRPKNKRFAYVHFDSTNHVVSTKLMVLRATGAVSSLFAYLILKEDSTIDYLQMMAESRSGTFPQITFDILSKIEIVLPKDVELVTTFTNTFLEPIFQRQLKNDLMSETLANLRDTLLPKLISGELRIPDAEKLVAEAL